MDLTKSLKDITSLFEQEITLSTSLLSVMKNEQSALSVNDLPAFESAVMEKIKLISEIESTEKKLVNILDPHGASIDKKDINTLVSQGNKQDKEKISLLMDKLSDIAEQCQKQNLINSKIIDSSNNNIQKIIGILRGQTADNGGLYDLSGKSSNKILPQTLGRV